MAMRDGSTLLWKPGVGAQIDRSHPAAQGLVACWLCNENGGGMLTDSVGRFHFTLTGGVSRVAEPLGPAIKFDGTSGQGVAVGHPLAAATAFTVLFRLRQKDALANPFGPYLGNNLNYNSGVYIGQNDPAVLQFYVGTVNLSVGVTNGVWSHYACQWSNATGIQRAFTNGVQTANATGISATIPAYTNTYIGQSSVGGGGYFTDSALSFLKVYNRFLSAAEIVADYGSPYAMFTPPNARRLFAIAAQSGSSLVGGLSIGAGRLSIGVQGMANGILASVWLAGGDDPASAVAVAAPGLRPG